MDRKMKELQLDKHGCTIACILSLCPLDGNLMSTHTVVFDAQEHCILDPREILKDLSKYNVYCCIEIL